MSDHIHTDHIVHEPVYVERSPSIFGIVVALVIGLLLAGAIWFVFFTDQETRDAVVPDDVNVTVDVNGS